MEIKQIKDYPLKNNTDGNEDILIQDNGVTKRIKTSTIVDSVDFSDYYTTTEIDTKLNNKANTSDLHNHSNKTVLDNINTTKISNWDTAYNHSKSNHAPVNAEENVQSDWNIDDTNSDAYIKNKPTIPDKTSQLTNDSNFLTSIPTASETVLGGVKVGNGLAISDGTLSVNNVDTLSTITVSNGTLTLTTSKYQYASLSSGNTIVLPTVNSNFVEIHLFFNASSDIVLTLPSGVKWQTIPSVTSGHVYELIFTYVVDNWLGGVVQYG